MHPEFDLSPDLCYLNHAAVAPWPRRAVAAVTRFAEANGRCGSSDYAAWLATEQRLRERLADLIQDEASAKPFEAAFALALQDTLAMVLDKLSEREMRIIKLRFGLDGEGPFTLEETGKILGITRERVRQIQERAIVKLKQLRVAGELEAFLQH